MMKKRMTAVVFAVMLAGAVTACGSKDSDQDSNTGKTVSGQEETADSAGQAVDDGTTYLKDIKALDYVALGDYKGVEITLADPVVTDEYLNNYIEYTLQNSPVKNPVTDRAVESGDSVNMDYEGKMDGTVFDGGSAEGFDLVIGSGRFIPGFEDGVIGMKTGETKDVTVSFPDPYEGNPDYSGKEAVFTVTVNSIDMLETPELTDEFVAGQNITDVKTVDEYKKYATDMLAKQLESEYENQKTNMILDAVFGKCTFQDVPKGMLSRMQTTLTNNLTSYASMYGMDLPSYLASYYGITQDNYEQEMINQAESMAKNYLMMQAIADQENLGITDEDVDAQIQEEAAQYGYENADEYKAAIDVEAYREYMMTTRVIEFLSENTVVNPA